MSHITLHHDDVQNMRYRPRGEAGAGGHHSKAPIGASAGEVGKAGTIDWGYLQTRPDQFGSKGYDLLDEEQQQQQQQPGAVLSCWLINQGS